MWNVVVAGSINIDLVASTPRHPRPGETVTGTDLQYLPGGKGANQAVASARAGAPVTMMGTVGDDVVADQLLGSLRDAGVNVDHVSRCEGVPTGTALVVVDAEGENTIVVVPGANATLNADVLVAFDPRPGDIVLAQYETPLAATAAFFQHGREAGAICVLNPAPAAPTSSELLELVDILVLNETELAVLSGADISRDASESEIIDAIDKLRGVGLSGTTVATLGVRGALVVVGDRAFHMPAHHVRPVDTTGAGDCFVGSLAAELANGSPLDIAIEFANAAAALCVTKPGAAPSMPTRAEVDTFRNARSETP